MQEPTITYHLVKLDGSDPPVDFARMVSLLQEGYPQLRITPLAEAAVRISHDKSNVPVEFTTAPFLLDPTLGDRPGMQITMGNSDSAALHLFRSIARDLGYRVYHSLHRAFMVTDPDLVDAGQLQPTEQIFGIFKAKRLTPLYLHSETSVQYAVSDADHSVHIINPGMFQFFHDHGTIEAQTPEFSYPVATSVVQFTAFYDASLVPTNFYRYWRRDQKIINYSFIDVRSPERQLSVHPYIHAYNAVHGSYEPFAGAGKLPQAVSIGPKESIDATITRVVRDELKIAGGYQRAKVGEYVSFVRDADQSLTPLLHVDVYLTVPAAAPRPNPQPQRGWDHMAAG
jgi:hypothetical protein